MPLLADNMAFRAANIRLNPLTDISLDDLRLVNCNVLDTCSDLLRFELDEDTVGMIPPSTIVTAVTTGDEHEELVIPSDKECINMHHIGNHFVVSQKTFVGKCRYFLILS